MRWVGLVHCNQTVNIRLKVCQEQSQIYPLCCVEFVSLFGEEPGHSAESPLNQVGSRKSNEKQLDVFSQGWVAFWNRCLHLKGLVRGFELWFQILVILQTYKFLFLMSWHLCAGFSKRIDHPTRDFKRKWVVESN